MTDLLPSDLLTSFRLALVIPATYHSVKASVTSGSGSKSGALLFFENDDTLPDLDPIDQKGLLAISRGTSILLLAVYIVYLWFQGSNEIYFCMLVLTSRFMQLKSHNYLFQAPEGEEETIPEMSTVSAASAYTQCPSHLVLR